MFLKVSRNEYAKMRREGGYRENRIMDNASCYTTCGSSRYVKVHNRKKTGSSFDTAVFDRKTVRWVN